MRKAIDALVREGYVSEVAGRNNSKMCASVKPYRAPADGSSSGSALVRPEIVPDAPVAGSSRSSPLYKGDELTDEDEQFAHDLWLDQFDAPSQALFEDAS